MGACLNCVLGTYFNSETPACAACDPTCRSCSGVGSRTACPASTPASSRGGTCHSCISNCAACITTSTCQLYDLGYYLNSNTCAACSANNCVYCTSSSTCVVCALGYKDSPCVACGGDCLACTSSACLLSAGSNFRLGTLRLSNNNQISNDP
jgi:hypothetical protein